jgi:hypothetical protein
MGGLHFTFAINKNQELYHWGKGDYGVFGDGENKSHAVPQLNEYFNNWKEGDFDGLVASTNDPNK